MTEVSNTRVVLMAFIVSAIALVAFGGLTAHEVEAKSMIRKHASSTTTHATSTTPTTLDKSCVSTAIQAREKSIKEAFSDHNTSIMTALDERLENLLAAWKIGDKNKRQKENASMWKEWRKAKVAADKELQKDRKAAWDTFRTTVVKTCKEKVEDTGSGDE